MRNSNGFTLVEILVSLSLMAFAISLTVNAMNFSSRAADNIESELISSFSSIEASTQNYFNDKSAYPTGLADATFVPVYLFVPMAPSSYDRAYGVSGFYMAKRTGQSSPNNGYYICTKVTVDNASDYRFIAMKQVSSRLSASKYFYNSTCPAITNAADPTIATTLYPTYWITRE